MGCYLVAIITKSCVNAFSASLPLGRVSSSLTFPLGGSVSSSVLIVVSSLLPRWLAGRLVWCPWDAIDHVSWSSGSVLQVCSVLQMPRSPGLNIFLHIDACLLPIPLPSVVWPLEISSVEILQLALWSVCLFLFLIYPLLFHHHLFARFVFSSRFVFNCIPADFYHICGFFAQFYHISSSFYNDIIVVFYALELLAFLSFWTAYVYSLQKCDDLLQFPVTSPSLSGVPWLVKTAQLLSPVHSPGKLSDSFAVPLRPPYHLYITSFALRILRRFPCQPVCSMLGPPPSLYRQTPWSEVKWSVFSMTAPQRPRRGALYDMKDNDVICDQIRPNHGYSYTLPAL